MFKNYFKISIRNLYKHPFYSIINIAGLAIGIACVLFIIFYVQDELSYDRYNKNADRIYRIVSDFHFKGNDLVVGQCGAPVGPGMISEFPEIETFTRFSQGGNTFVRTEDKVYRESNIFYADSTFFDVFTVPLIYGDKRNALNVGNKVVISQTLAHKYFGSANPIGKILKVNDYLEFNITGVFADIPKASHFHADIIASIYSDKRLPKDLWSNANYPTYIVLKPGTDAKQLETKFPYLVKKYLFPEVEKFLGIMPENMESSGVKVGYRLQPLLDIHLYNYAKGEFEPGGDIKYVYIFSAIGLFILLLACINFINLSTARSANRAKEVGIKKVVGSSRRELIMQFLAESIIISAISAVIAVGIVELLLPYFNDLAGKEIETSYFGNFVISISILLIVIVAGVLAGSFPAFVLSAFNPAVVLKGNIAAGSRKAWLRRGLVVFQFTTSIVLIICTFVVLNQLDYIQNKRLGYDKEHVLIVEDTYILGDKSEAFKQEILRNPGIISATVTGFLPVDSYRSNCGTFPDANINMENMRPIQTWRVDYDYIKTMGIKIIDGRDFSRDFSSDSDAVIINESCAKFYGWKNPLEHSIGNYAESYKMKKYNVIGVIQDFNFESLKNEVEPLVLYIHRSSGKISFRIKTSDIHGLISSIKSTWDKFATGQPISYKFMDESFNAMYQSENRISKIFGTFAAIAILVGCLGLFGLSAFTATKKTKEIGIRKVHGATVKNIVVLLSKEFAKLVGVAFIIAAPVAYYLMSNWLDNYAYKTSLDAWTFILAGALAMIIALITVGYHAVKAALINPAQSLKYE